MSLALIKRYAVNFRVLWLAGRYGSGKTAFAHYLAYHLLKDYGFRYLVSNVKGVWADDPASVKLERRNEREGLKADAVVILDEAGEFVGSKSDADKWLYGLRKINTVLILPSVRPPYGDLRSIEIRRRWNGQGFLLPMWRYGVEMNNGSEHEEFAYNWWFPDKIFGVYDTDGYPSDANEILTAMKDWIAQSAKDGGYEATANKVSPTKISFEREGSELREAVANIGGEIDQFREIQRSAQRTLSILERKTRRRGRR